MLRITKAAILLLLLITVTISHISVVGSPLESLSSNGQENDSVVEGQDDNEIVSDIINENHNKATTDPLFRRKSLRHRNRHDLKGSRVLNSSSDSGKGKGKGSGSGSQKSKGVKSKVCHSILDPDIEPRPYINCIPHPVPPPKSPKAMSTTKGKGKGKGNRRDDRRRRSKSASRLLLLSDDTDDEPDFGEKEEQETNNHSNNDYNTVRSMQQPIRKLEGKGPSSGNGNRNGSGKGKGGGRPGKLPCCPFETFNPTFLPTLTPIPTYTPLPTVTPVPTYTPLPSSTPFPTKDNTTPSASPSTSAAPSKSFAPSATPSRSFAPSKSAMPSTTPNTFSRTVPSRLGYGFFPGTTIRQPTTQETNGLIVQTERFYTDLFRATYGSRFSSFTMQNIVETFDSRASLPVVQDFNAIVNFATGATNIPNTNEVFNVMDGADYQTFIMMYVWSAEPAGGASIFFDTQRVSFGRRGQQL